MGNWNEQKLDILLKEVSLGAKDCGDIDDCMAFDIADGVLASEPGLKEYLESKGITDAIGHIANYVF